MSSPSRSKAARTVEYLEPAGEAEKSHQSAKLRGFVEFWTIYNVPSLQSREGAREISTTNRFTA